MNVGKQMPKVWALSCLIAGAPVAWMNAEPVSETPVVSQQRNLTGVVKDKSGETIPGANILVKGTANGVVTDMDGNYTISIPGNQAILVVSFIGYKTQEFPVGKNTSLDVILSSTVEQLDEVVVTALGIKREKKALGYAMQEIKTDALSENRSESVANMLQGKVAGVQISQSGTGMGGSTRVIMRGLNSLSGNNQPLWVVDGIPISDGVPEQPNEWGGTDYSGAASDINPDDIESISVLKGANAAALYGSRAQNGAIIVTTKKGKAGQPLSIEYNGNVNFSQVYNPYDYQNVYSQGTGGKYDSGAKGSWGEEMSGAGSPVPNWRNTIYHDSDYKDYVLSPQSDYITDFYRTGVNYNNTLTATAGGEHTATRLSFTDSRNQGITPSHQLNRQYYDLNSSFTSKYIDLGAKVNFMRQKGMHRPGQGEYGVMTQLVKMPRGIRMQDLVDPVGKDGYLVNWSGPSNEYRNPYSMTMPENGNDDTRNRLIGQLSATAKFTDYLKLTGRVGLDWYNDQRKVYSGVIQPSSTASQYNTSQSTNEEFNADAILNFNKTFGDFNVNVNLGAATMTIKANSLSGSAGLLYIPGLMALSNGQSQEVSEYFSKKRTNSLFGNASVGFRSMVYLDVTGRNDWSSTLPSTNWSYFYPSVSLSGIISEMVKLPEQISFLKVRGSLAKVGNDTQAYRLQNMYYLGRTIKSVVNASIPNSDNKAALALADLRPEETTSWEAGLELRMFNGRLGLDGTYYKSSTVNQILSVGMPISSGYTSKFINAGKMSSHGVEIMLNGTPIQTKDWQWDINVNWGTNTTECIELDPEVKRFELGTTRIGKVVVDEGRKFGEIVGKAFKRDDQGRILVDDNGLPLSETDQIIGNMLPKWTGSVGTTLRFRNLTFNALIDIRHGGDFISMTDNYASQTGTSAKTVDMRKEGMLVDGIVQSTGAQNTLRVSAEDYFATIGGPGGVSEAFMYDASYVKMRELSVGYILPSIWLKNLPIQSVKISAVGRDLFFFHKNAPVNPEGAFSREDYAQAFEFASLPPTRSFGFTLNVKF